MSRFFRSSLLSKCGPRTSDISITSIRNADNEVNQHLVFNKIQGDSHAHEKSDKFYHKPRILTLEYATASPSQFRHSRLGTPHPQHLIQNIWGVAGESAFLISSQVILMVLVLGPHFENHCVSCFMSRSLAGFKLAVFKPVIRLFCRNGREGWENN